MMDNRMTITRKQKWEGKQLYGYFKRLINNISYDKTWTWLRKENFKRETINHIISKCCKFSQKEYNTRHDWVGKAIHWEMSKKFKFDHTNKWYMHNPAPVLENNTHKLLWDFDIHTDHLIPARRPDLIIINKKKQKKRENLQNC